MPDITMCNNKTCWLRNGCERSPDSGTKPQTFRQSWTEFKPGLAKINHQIIHFCEFFSPTKVVAETPTRDILDKIENPTGWCTNMAIAPRDLRILVLSDPSGEVYVAHWVQHPSTGDEAWLISESTDGSQHLCKPRAWRHIPGVPHG